MRIKNLQQKQVFKYASAIFEISERNKFSYISEK